MIQDTARAKILAAAGELFAGKGFDGTSTAQIAKAAGVNSALIFYYFTSKENLLKCLISEKVTDYRKSRSIRPETFNHTEMTSKVLEHLLQESMTFLKSNEELFRILIMELFKKSSGNLNAFEINHEMMVDVFSLLKNEAGMAGETYPVELKEMFFLTLPMVAFMLLEEKLASYYSIQKSELESRILDVCKEVYIRLMPADLGLNIQNESEGG